MLTTDDRRILTDAADMLDAISAGHRIDNPIAVAQNATAAKLRAIVDRPAPTPAPAPGLDLEAIERDVSTVLGGSDMYEESGRASIRDTLRNAAPALIAEVRALRARLAESTAAAVALAAEADGLRAGLAEAKRLGLEACSRIEGAAACLQAKSDRTARLMWADSINSARAAIRAALEAL